MLARAIVVLLLGILALADAPEASATAVEQGGCNIALPTNCSAPEDDLHAICTAMCPTWTRAACWEDIGLICDTVQN